MDHATYTDIVAAESARALTALRKADLTAIVPTCPEWTAADLAWHLAEVQDFWAAIAGGPMLDPDGYMDPERPADDRILAYLADRSAALVAVLRTRDPQERCWSWHADGWSVGWVGRRQAHEALIHRVDAEVVAKRPVTTVDPKLASDGVDELLVGMLQLPDWGTVEPDGHAVAVEAADTGDRWTLRFVRFSGTSPNTGERHELDGVELDPGRTDVGATVAGTAWDLDRWLWGRAPDQGLTVTGDRGLVHRLRAAAEVE